MRGPEKRSAEVRRRRVSRRTFLHGVGVTMTLPWLESIPVWGTEVASGGATASASAAAFPRRFAALFMACGVNFPNWWAKGAGTEMQLGRCLEPMEPYKTHLNVIDGLFNRSAVGVGIHPGQTGNILSGAALQKGAELRGGISMDQVLANHFAEETLLPSMVLGCEQPITGYHETNFSMAYSSHISWESASSPVPMEVYPSLAFDSLFENRGQMRNRSILDRVREEAADLSRKISVDDRSKLDEYLTSVRDVEKRITSMRAAQDRAEQNAAHRGQPLLAMERPDNGLPEDIRDHMRLMCDIVALAFQTDKTRVATLLLCRDISGMFYPFLDVRSSHHPSSHRDEGEGYEKITRYYVSQFAYLTGRLAEMREGEGSVLDNTCLVFLSNMWSGKAHDATRLPLLQTGRLGGTIETGRVLNYLGLGDENRKLCSLYLSLMDRMGVPLKGFGDASTRLAGL
jgi:hypothetical protein